MNTTLPHGSWRHLSLNYDEALARLPEALKKEGFGIISEIDLKATFKTKLDVDFRRYRVIGACNPSFALKALQTDPQVGLLLPCNLALYETEDGKSMLGAIDPMRTLGADAGDLVGVAREIASKLERVLNALAS